MILNKPNRGERPYSRDSRGRWVTNSDQVKQLRSIVAVTAGMVTPIASCLVT